MEDDMASPSLEIGSTVAYARLPIGWRKMGRADARRRDVVGRMEAIPDCQILKVECSVEDTE